MIPGKKPASAAKQDRFAKAAEGVAAAGRAIQKQVDRLEKQRSKAKKHKGAMQAGAFEILHPPRVGYADRHE